MTIPNGMAGYGVKVAITKMVNEDPELPWYGLYVNGWRTYQGFDLNVERLVNIIDGRNVTIAMETIPFDDDIADFGFPERLIDGS